MSADLRRAAILAATGGQNVLPSFFNPREAVSIHEHRLPHWQQEGVSYFVTFRLADSLPVAKLRDFTLERKTWLSAHPQPWSEEEEAQYDDTFSKRVDDWLDLGSGDCILRDDRVAQIVSLALRHFDGERYVMQSFAVMPNHVHVLFRPLGLWKIEDILHSWKSYSANEINRVLHRTGRVWMEDYWDRMIRSEQHLCHVLRYISENPAKVGLAENKHILFQRPIDAGAGQGGQDARPPGLSAIIAAVLAFLLPACDWMPGKPRKDEAYVAPAAVANFQQLFTQNCLGCHGNAGAISGSIALDDPLYLAIIPPETLREIIAAGVPGTLMPPFSQANGGLLTDAQITVLVQGIMAWKKSDAPAGLPPYSAPPGNAMAGEPIYAAYVAGLRQTAGEGMVADGFLANPAFLGLSSDQYLRTLIITGRPELGIPTYQTALAGQPLSEQQISDLVAWLISQRKNEFGQPLVPAKP